MAQLPIRNLTLWKQGIGYFERRGTVQEASISLTIPRGATNDVLKSLNIVVYSSGQVLSVDYETPEDKHKLLATLPVRLTERASLVDLLVSLRGTPVILQLDNDEQASGRLIGVESSLDAAAQAPVVMLQGSDATLPQVSVIPVSRLVGITLQDERAVNDVRFFLDVTRIEQTRTTLTLHLSAGEQDTGVGYLAPGPAWRVSYRLMRTGENRAALTAWGIFENSLDEDLENIGLTLISGRPISFVYDLYESHVPKRPEVSDDTDALEQMAGDPRLAEAMSAITHDLRSPLSVITGYTDMLSMQGPLNSEQQSSLRTMQETIHRLNQMINDLLSMVRVRDTGEAGDRRTLASFYRTGPLGDLKVSGRYFIPVIMSNADASFMTYRVANPVTVRRGQSAMVPILQAEVDYRALCVFNGDKMPNHPLLVWDFQNTTGYALEQGPVTLVADGYAGEGLLRFAGVSDNIQIPYALEFGILVTEETRREEPELYQIEFDAVRRKALVRHAVITGHRYTLTSRVERDITVLIERRDPQQGEYFRMTTPEFAAAGHSRWPVMVAAHGTAEFLIQIRSITESVEEVSTWSAAYIAGLKASGLLSAGQDRFLLNLLAARSRIQDSQAEMKSLQAQQTGVQALQEQIRKNLGALGTSEREIGIRNRILDDLENSENRRREIDARIQALENAVIAAGQDQMAALNGLYAAS